MTSLFPPSFNPSTDDSRPLTDPLAAMEAEVVGASSSAANLLSPQASEEDLLTAIMQAAGLQQQGQLAEAIAIYQQVAAQNPDGQYGAIARKSLDSLGGTDLQAVGTPTLLQSPSVAQVVKSQDADRQLVQRRSWLQRFYNLPIRHKQVTGLLTSQAVSILGLVGIGGGLLVSGLRTQILQQSKAELAVSVIQYNIKINQMGFGFRGQSDNAAIIAAAQTKTSSPLVLKALRNEIKARQIEYATLVDSNFRIITSANRDRRGEVFNPENLVSASFKLGQQIKTTAIVPWAELQREAPPLPPNVRGQDGLIRYVVTPVRDPVTRKIIGALIAGDLVNNKVPIVLNTVEAFNSGYSAIYVRKSDGTFALSASAYRDPDYLRGLRSSIPLQTTKVLDQAVAAGGEPVAERVQIRGRTYSVSARTIVSYYGQPTAILVRGTSESGLNSLMQSSLMTLGTASTLIILMNVAIAFLLARTIARPISRLKQSAEQLSAGNRTARAEVLSIDEIGQLAVTFNTMADTLVQQTEQVEKLAEERRQEAEQERQEAERLQQRVIELLLQIDDARQGDLTVRAKVTDDEMGSIADAFNATVASLQNLVLQVQSASQQVNEGATTSDESMSHLAQSSQEQAEAIAKALTTVEQMVHSTNSVASSAAKAAEIARQASAAATSGGAAMEHTVESINELRSSVAETSKKVKRLTESSQEISKIVALISEISAKTNLLAFNASIEAVRAGEHGQGFRIVAEEVRRLAEQVTHATKEIEQLVTGIQQETGAVLTMMERGTAQVVKGSQLVSETKETLSGLVTVSQQIDHLLEAISARTASQTEASRQMSETMQAVAAGADATSTESLVVSGKLKQLLDLSTQLQASVVRFQVTR